MTDQEFIMMRLRENQRQHRATAAGGRLDRAAGRSGRYTLGAVAAIVALLGALIAGCGGNNNTPTGGRTPSTPLAATATGDVAGGTPLGDCEYARALGRALARFTGAVPAFGTENVQGRDAVIRSLDTFDGELAALIGELRGYRLTPDVARVNDGVTRVFEDARRQLPALRSAVAGGDVATLTTVATKLTGEVFPGLDRVQAENKAAINRLDRCATAHAPLTVETTRA